MSRRWLYKMQLAKGAVWSAVEVWFGHPIDPDTGETLTERPALWRAKLNGIEVPIESIYQIDVTSGTPQLLTKYAEEVDEDEIAFLTQDTAWARENEPTSPRANPRKRVDLNVMKPIRWHS